MKNRFIDLNEIINRATEYYAHIEGKDNETVKDSETLCQHTQCAAEYFLKIVSKKKIDGILDRIYKSIFGINMENYDKFMEIIYNVIVFHDMGKLNPKFQNKLRNNIFNKNDYGVGSQHSIISAVLFVYYFHNEIDEVSINDEEYKLVELIFICAHAIARHHSFLNNITKDRFIEKFEDDGENNVIVALKELLLTKDLFNISFLENWQDRVEIIQDNADLLRRNGFQKEFFILERLIYSLLVAADYYSTTEYMESNKTEFLDFRIEDFKKVYFESDLMNSIREKEKNESYKNSNDINDLRTEVFLEVEKVFEGQKEKNIFFLESPTGSGKSNIAMNLSYKLLNENRDKLIYAYPFNTLVEQNKKTLEEYYANTEYLSLISILNSITKITSEFDGDQDYDLKDFTKMVLDRQFLHSPFLITSSVKVFEILFGNQKQDLFGLYQIVNSVIVLDEIQAYRMSIWNEIIEMLDLYSELFNIKIIIMSATLPDLTEFLDEDRKDKIAKLVKNPKVIFGHSLFKNRVEINYELLDKEIDYDILKKHMLENINDYKKVLIEFISKKEAEEFFNILDMSEDFNDYKKCIITGDDNLLHKNEIIDLLKKDIKIILVATQVIEAGVDIDMDLGYKDISILENEEQFLGRINRSAKKEKAKAFFFDMKDIKAIYKESAEFYTLRNYDRRKDLINKDFEEYYKIKLKNIAENNIGVKDFYKYLKNLDFEKVDKHMKLIDDEYATVDLFIARKINSSLDGKKVWREYKELLTDNKMTYSEKYVKLFDKRTELNNFIYRIPAKTLLVNYEDRIGDIFYTEDEENLMENGRLRRNIEQIGSDIL